MLLRTKINFLDEILQKGYIDIDDINIGDNNIGDNNIDDNNMGDRIMISVISSLMLMTILILTISYHLKLVINMKSVLYITTLM